MFRVKKTAFIFLATFIPFAALALDIQGSSGVRMGATIFSVVNIILLVTSLISIRQFFWPGYENRLPFHIFNIIFAALFYGTSLPFLVANREYYVGYEMLSPLQVVGRFFFTLDVASAEQWVIIIALVCNVIYSVRNYKDYFQAGLVKDALGDDINEKETKVVETDVDAIP